MRPWTRKQCQLCGGERAWVGDPERYVRLRACPACDLIGRAPQLDQPNGS